MAGLKIGYIRKYLENDKEQFKYLEGNAVRRIGSKSDTVKTKFLYGTFPFEEVADNTKILKEHPDLIITREPFFTDDELKERIEKWCEWANSCEHREYSFFGEDKPCSNS